MSLREPPPPRIPGYTHVRFLAGGGYAFVYVYVQDSMRREVAIKVLDDRAADPDATSRKAPAEARTTVMIDRNEHIARAFDGGTTDDGRRYLVMDYYPEGDLLTRIKRAPLSVAEALRLGVQMADALVDIHQAGIIHCDVKPANILIDRAAYLLSDFGIASSTSAPRTDSEYGVSIPWSPREILDGAPGTVRSDLYSLGATLWHALMQHSPFAVPGGDNSAAAIERRIRTTTAPPLLLPGAPRALDDLLQRLLAVDPRSRPSSAREVRDALARIDGAGADRTVRREPEVRPDVTEPRVFEDPARTQLRDPRPADPPEGAQKTPGHRRRGLLWGAAGLAVVVAVVIGASLSAGTGRSPSAAATNAADFSEPPMAGIAGEAEAPGVPIVTAARSGPGTLHFSWRYSAADGSDTFLWQTADGARNGTAKSAALDLPDPTGTQLCVQVKVVRVDGSAAQVDWSPAGCGS